MGNCVAAKGVGETSLSLSYHKQTKDAAEGGFAGGGKSSVTLRINEEEEEETTQASVLNDSSRRGDNDQPRMLQRRQGFDHGGVISIRLSDDRLEVGSPAEEWTTTSDEDEEDEADSTNTSPHGPISPSSMPSIIETPFRAPTELGPIRCRYDSFEKALKAPSPRPLLHLGLEYDDMNDVPALNHPLVIEAAETLFHTFTTRADRSGGASYNQYHRRICIRVLDPCTKTELHTLRGDDLSLCSIVRMMVTALRQLNMIVPMYLAILSEEVSGMHKTIGGKLQRIDRHAVFGVNGETSSLQEAESDFGGLEGVLGTRVGHVEGEEVVHVSYDPSRLSFSNLVRFALQRGHCKVIFHHTNDERIATLVEVGRVNMTGGVTIGRLDGTIQPWVNPKHDLRKTLLRFVPLTDLQAARANHLVHEGVFNEAVRLLSPRQGMIMMGALQGPTKLELVDVPIARAWRSLSDLHHRSELLETAESQ